MTHIIAISGRRNAGKTTWVCALLDELKARGIRVGSIKRTHHDCLPPGKDTTRHLQSGAERVLLVSPGGPTMYEGWDEEPPIDQLVARHFASFDLVLAEGYRGEPLPRFVVGEDPGANTNDLLMRLPEVGPGGPDPSILAEAVQAIVQRIWVGGS